MKDYKGLMKSEIKFLKREINRPLDILEYKLKNSIPKDEIDEFLMYINEVKARATYLESFSLKVLDECSNNS